MNFFSFPIIEMQVSVGPAGNPGRDCDVPITWTSMLTNKLNQYKYIFFFFI